MARSLSVAGMALGVWMAGCGGGGGGSGGTGGSTNSGGTSTGGTDTTGPSSGGTSSGGGGTGSGVPTCVEEGLTFSVYGDVLAEDGSSADSGTITGQVVEVGFGGLGMNCAHVGQDSAWAKVQDANGVTWAVCVIAPTFEMPLQVGQTATIENELFLGENYSDSHGVAVRVDGALLFFVDYTLGGAQIHPPDEFSYSTGQTLCYSDIDIDCDTGVDELLVEVGGEQATLAQPAVSDVGGYTFHLGRYGTLGDNGGCEIAGQQTQLLVVPTN